MRHILLLSFILIKWSESDNFLISYGARIAIVIPVVRRLNLELWQVGMRLSRDVGSAAGSVAANQILLAALSACSLSS